MRFARPVVVATLIAGVASAIPTAARADTVTLAASRDAAIYQDDPGDGNSAGEHFFTGRNGEGWRRRALIAFDVAGSIPPGSTINAVTLTLTASRGSGDGFDIGLHRLLAPWGEGTSNPEEQEGGGIVATPGDPTWSHRIWDGTPWTAAGGDFAGAASATTFVGAFDDGTGSPFVWQSATMITDVQGWLDAPATNHGWLLLGAEPGGGNSRRFDSRTFPEPARRPALFVDFEPPTPVGACCAIDGSCSVVESPGTACGGTYQGDATDCNVVACPQPTGACCFATATATCELRTAVDCVAEGGGFVGEFAPCEEDLCPVVPTAYLDPLPIPAVATPTSGEPGAAATYTLAMKEFEQQLHSELPPTRVWGFDDGTGPSFPGPTIEAASGEPIEVVWRNQLRDASGNLRTSHFLAVEDCIHGAEDRAKTVVHLHGAHVPAAFDGHPDLTILPGEETTYRYPNGQRGATLWYHDHALGITRLNVYMGLSGFYLLRDPEEAALDLPRGVDEVPLVLQDRTLGVDGQLRYPAQWEHHVFGNLVLVNGRVWPFHEVRRGQTRLRLLNGSGSRTYRLALSNGATFRQIGSDGGLLDAPVIRTQILIQPGERADVVVDFGAYPEGSTIDLVNDAPAPYPLGAGEVVSTVMRFVVGPEVGHTTPVPEVLTPIAAPDESAAVATRDLVLRMEDDACGGMAWRINGLGFHDVVERPRLGTSEVWRFVNASNVSHPMHMHLVQFRVLDRQPVELVNGEPVPIGVATPPPAEEAGWKDTVRVDPLEVVRVLARFERYTGLFSYHCHILEHEDHDMMRQFEAVTECGDGALGEPDEECDDANLVDGDGCAADCSIEGEGGAGGSGAGSVSSSSGSAGGPSGGGAGDPVGGPGAGGAPGATTGGVGDGGASGGGADGDGATADGCDCRAAPGRVASGRMLEGHVGIAALLAVAVASRRRRRSPPFPG